MNSMPFIPYALNLYDARYTAQEISYHTWYNGRRMLLSFQRFCSDALCRNDVAIADIDVGLLQKYRRYCLEVKKNRPLTVNRKIAPVIQALSYAKDEGLISPGAMEALRKAYCQTTPHRYGSEAEKLRNTEGGGPVRHLDDYQLHRLQDYHRSLPESAERDALDLFFFSFHACGLRVSDIVTLEWSQVDMEGALLSKVMVKSKTWLSIPLTPPALAILGRWMRRRPDGRFVFGLLPDRFDLGADAVLSRAIDNRNRTLFRRLSGIGRKLDFPLPLGMHVARHSFAVKALNGARIDVHVVSRLMGHSSVVVTEKVYAKFLLPTLSRELNERLSLPEFSV